MDIGKALKHLHPTAAAGVDYKIADHGNGPIIEHWNSDKLGVLPVQEDLDAALVDANREDARQAFKDQRDNALSSMVHDFGDGRVMQVRPEDLANIQIAIEQGVSREWVMSNNTVAQVTVTDLQAAVSSGIAQAESIWNNYMTQIKAL